MHRLGASCIALLLALSVVPAAAEGRRGRPERAVPAFAPAGRDGLARALARGRLKPAEYALERAASVFRSARERAHSKRHWGTDPRLATMYLRDLAVRVRYLQGDKRRRAQRLLARPTDGAADPQGTGYSVPPEDVRRDCTEDFCIHWVETTADAPPLDDADANGIPDWIDQMRRELTTIWSHFTSLGFREPKSDATSPNSGGDGRLDVYVMNLFPQGMYGYCATDDPAVTVPQSRYEYFDASAYCVLENDYAEYPQPGLPSLQVTAAHELFHAVQYAYDAFEDVWFLEGTAVWMEDEIYDHINDHYQYLRASHLTAPHVPLDTGDFAAEPYPYASFLFWRFLSEYDALGSDPGVIREIWERADASPLGPHRAGFDDYSLRAVEKELAERGVSFARALNDFAVWNFVPEAFYEEGAAYLARVGGRPSFRKDVVVTRSRPKRKGSVSLDHLTSAYLSFRPGTGVQQRGANLVVKVDGPRRFKGTAASILVLHRDGTFTTRTMSLDRAGDGKLRPSFGRADIERIVVALTNASTRFDGDTCYRGTTHFSCGGGVPRDDSQVFSFVAILRQ